MPKRNIYRDGSRVYQEGRRFLKVVIPAILKPAHTLWHELIGFIFLVIASAFVFRGFQAIRQFDGSLDSIFRLVLLAFGIALMGGYGISSFRRARRISRS